MLSFFRPCDVFEQLHLSVEPLDVTVLAQEPFAGIYYFNAVNCSLAKLTTKSG